MRKRKRNKSMSLRKAEASLQKYYDKLDISKTKVSSPHEIPNYKCEGTQYPSLGTGIGNGAKKTHNIYTGTDIVGIATMHKSNAVPIRRCTNEAIEIAQMGS
jgi:hypothetical protein